MVGVEELAKALPAPVGLSAREVRYRGEEDGIPLAMLRPQDVAAVRVIYDELGKILDALRPAALGSAEDGSERVRALLGQPEWDRAVEAARWLGEGLGSGADLAVRKALHDVRGGSFQGLFIHLDLIEAGLEEPGDGERAFILARDHRKMMRNALIDLDEAGYDVDLAPRPHRVALLQEKWDDVAYQIGEHQARVTLEAGFDGSVSERCMEFAALDRVLYNLVNNAARFAADQRVRVAVLPEDHGGETHLRFVVANAVSEGQQAALDEAFGADLSKVFGSGFTTGGHGVGLRIVADVVAHGYGIAPSEAIATGHLGARLVDGHYVAWFFWPAVPTE